MRTSFQFASADPYTWSIQGVQHAAEASGRRCVRTIFTGCLASFITKHIIYSRPRKTLFSHGGGGGGVCSESEWCSLP